MPSFMLVVDGMSVTGITFSLESALLKNPAFISIFVFLSNILEYLIKSTDKSGANKAGIDFIQFHLKLFYFFTGIFLSIQVRQIKYLNNIIELDHRFIKKITRPMKGFKSLHSAHATIAGIELHHMLRKRQHQQSKIQPLHEQFMGLAA